MCPPRSATLNQPKCVLVLRRSPPRSRQEWCKEELQWSDTNRTNNVQTFSEWSFLTRYCQCDIHALRNFYLIVWSYLKKCLISRRSPAKTWTSSSRRSSTSENLLNKYPIFPKFPKKLLSLSIFHFLASLPASPSSSYRKVLTQNCHLFPNRLYSYLFSEKRFCIIKVL